MVQDPLNKEGVSTFKPRPLKWGLKARADFHNIYPSGITFSLGNSSWSKGSSQLPPGDGPGSSKFLSQGPLGFKALGRVPVLPDQGLLRQQ